MKTRKVNELKDAVCEVERINFEHAKKVEDLSSGIQKIIQEIFDRARLDEVRK